MINNHIALKSNSKIILEHIFVLEAASVSKLYLVDFLDYLRKSLVRSSLIVSNEFKKIFTEDTDFRVIWEIV